MMSTENISNVNFVLDRMKEFYEFRSDRQLYEFLGVPQATLAGWRRRNTMDYDIVIAKCADKMNLHWLFTGEGSKAKNIVISERYEHYGDGDPPQRREILERISKMNLQQLSDLLKHLETEELLAELRISRKKS